MTVQPTEASVTTEGVATQLVCPAISERVNLESAASVIPNESDTSIEGCQLPGELAPQKLLQLGVLWPALVDRICAEETRTQFLVEEFIPAKSIAMVGGDSTIGKSPLVCQLALCVAAGIPFFDMQTNQGRVLYFDLENSLWDCKGMRDALVNFLGLSEPPGDFLLMQDPQVSLERLLEEVTPRLVVIDSVRAYRPDVTKDNTAAGAWLKELRRLSRKYNCAFVLVHHLRKPGLNSSGRNVVEETRVVEWMLEMEGPRAFVNQTDVRVAVADGEDKPAALNVKWSRRIHGDSPLVLLERVFEQGDPAGYRILTGRDFLSIEQQKALDKLPSDIEWTFKEAKQALGEVLWGAASARPAPDNRTNEFLNKSKQHRLIEKLGRNRYRKTAAPTQVPVPSDATQNGGVVGVSNQVAHDQVDEAKGA